MGGKKKYRVTIKNESFSYTVVIEAGEKTTMAEFKELAARKVRKQYGASIPRNVVVDLEFEIVK
jgi:hypothetical protein